MNIENIKWINFNTISDVRGKLTSIEGEFDVPFDVKRIFYMHDVTQERGGHAHIETDQVVIAVNGSFKVDISDGRNKLTFVFDDKSRGLYVPRLLFTRLFDFTKDAVCLVLANTHYDMKKSLRDWDSYIKYLESN